MRQASELAGVVALDCPLIIPAALHRPAFRHHSTFDTRDVDKSQSSMGCGTHIITGGTGKYAGITGSEPFACNAMPALAGAGGYTAMDIPHNTTWEIK
jgi:hypothetical protein